MASLVFKVKTRLVGDAIAVAACGLCGDVCWLRQWRYEYSICGSKKWQQAVAVDLDQKTETPPSCFATAARPHTVKG